MVLEDRWAGAQQAAANRGWGRRRCSQPQTLDLSRAGASSPSGQAGALRHAGHPSRTCCEKLASVATLLKTVRVVATATARHSSRKRTESSRPANRCRSATSSAIAGARAGETTVSLRDGGAQGADPGELRWTQAQACRGEPAARETAAEVAAGSGGGRQCRLLAAGPQASAQLQTLYTSALPAPDRRRRARACRHRLSQQRPRAPCGRGSGARQRRSAPSRRARASASTCAGSCQRRSPGGRWGPPSPGLPLRLPGHAWLEPHVSRSDSVRQLVRRAHPSSQPVRETAHLPRSPPAAGPPGAGAARAPGGAPRRRSPPCAGPSSRPPGPGSPPPCAPGAPSCPGRR